MTETAIDTDLGVKIRESVKISIDKIHPNDWNPFEEEDLTFNNLVEEIRIHGFKDPITVVPDKEGKYGKYSSLSTDVSPELIHYIIIGGEHRYKAAKVLGMESIPCFIEEDWDETKQKLQTVRDNLIKGELNSVKFTKLVNSLQEKVEIDKETMARMMGFNNDKEFAKYFIEEKEKRDKSFIDGLMDEGKRERHAIDSITDIVSTIFDSGKKTIDQSYMMFTYKGKLHCVVMLDKNGAEAMNKMGDKLTSSGANASDFIRNAIESKLLSD